MPRPQSIQHDRWIGDVGRAESYVRVLNRIVDIGDHRSPRAKGWNHVTAGLACAGTTEQREQKKGERSHSGGLDVRGSNEFFREQSGGDRRFLHAPVSSSRVRVT
jgi:hypothetical protein